MTLSEMRLMVSGSDEMYSYFQCCSVMTMSRCLYLLTSLYLYLDFKCCSIMLRCLYLPASSILSLCLDVDGPHPHLHSPWQGALLERYKNKDK